MRTPGFNDKLWVESASVPFLRNAAEIAVPARPSLSLRFGSESPTWLVSVAVIRENRGID
jgi:hypothetical protein